MAQEMPAASLAWGMANAGPFPAFPTGLPVQLAPVPLSGAFGAGSQPSMPPPQLPKQVTDAQVVDGKLQGLVNRAASLPPPDMPRRIHRRRTQEARDIIAMQNLLPNLLPDGDAHADTLPRRPSMEATSSYVNDEPQSPAADVGGEPDLGGNRSWQTPATDHPLTAAESADMLQRVQHDLLGMDITKLKGPLAEIARKNMPAMPPAVVTTTDPRAGLTKSLPEYNRAQSMTVSPKEAFLDYDKKLGSLSPTAKQGDRFTSPMPSLFGSISNPNSTKPSPVSPFRGNVRIDERRLSHSPPFAPPASAPLSRGQSHPAPRSPSLGDRSLHPVRRSMEPEAAPRNAVRWISTKKEPLDFAQMLRQGEDTEGQFDWSPSSEEGEGGIPLENPPTPPQQQAIVVPEQPLSAKPMPDVEIPFGDFSHHPLSADLAYIHQVPEAPTFQVPESQSAFPVPELPTSFEQPPAPIVSAAEPSPPAVRARPAALQLPPRASRGRATAEREETAPLATPSESNERTTMDEDESDDDQSDGSEDDYLPANGQRLAGGTRTVNETPPFAASVVKRQRMAAAAEGAAAAQQEMEDEEDEEFEDDWSEKEEEIRPTKQRKTNKGEAKPKQATPANAPRQRNSGNRGGDGNILCDHVDPETGAKCNTAFRRPYDLARHKETKHSNRTEKPQWVCDTCKSSFSRKDALMRHARLRSHKAQ